MRKTIEEEMEMKPRKVSNYSISNKKIDALYKVVSDDIMDARIKIAKLFRERPVGYPILIEDILSDISVTAPQKAIDLFKKKQP